MTAEARGDVGPVWHEAFTLPLVFLSAALLGGLRIDAGGGLAFVRPPLFALVLAVMLIAALYRSGAFDPARLFHPRRTGLAKASGAVIVVALAAAAAQMMAALTPDEGLFALAFDIVWLVLFGNTLAARPNRARLLSSLLVMFGAAFVVKFILLGALYAPDASVTKRVVMALVEGVSLGTLAYSRLARRPAASRSPPACCSSPASPRSRTAPNRAPGTRSCVSSPARWSSQTSRRPSSAARSTAARTRATSWPSTAAASGAWARAVRPWLQPSPDQPPRRPWPGPWRPWPRPWAGSIACTCDRIRNGRARRALAWVSWR